MSGHRRRKCGREAGLREFPCIIKQKTDNEAALYLVDTNLITRKNIKPTERAKAYALRIKALKDEKIRTNIDKDILNDLEGVGKMEIRVALENENNTSRGNIQRYLRINYLSKDLQNVVDNEKISLKTAEHLSFLGEKEQNMVYSLIADENIKITELQAKNIKDIYKDDNRKLTAEILHEIVKKNKKQREEITVTFSKQEIIEYFEGNCNEIDIKNKIILLLKAKSTPSVNEVV